MLNVYAGSTLLAKMPTAAMHIVGKEMNFVNLTLLHNSTLHPHIVAPHVIAEAIKEEVLPTQQPLPSR